VIGQAIQDELNYITETIVTNYQPEKIVLFGSFAYGKHTPDSDIDMLIIKETKEEPRARRMKLRKLIYQKYIEHPFSPLVYTDAELKHRLSLGDFFLREIIEQGKTLYEK
jgi:predicted nucleotidyltransferase